jgi:hypothetical protein
MIVANIDMPMAHVGTAPLAAKYACVEFCFFEKYTPTPTAASTERMIIV